MYDIDRDTWVRLEEREHDGFIFDVMCSLGDWVYKIVSGRVKRIDAGAMLRGKKRKWQDQFFMAVHCVA